MILQQVVGHALDYKGISYVSLASAKKDRRSNLDTFKTDPDCSVLLIILSTLGLILKQWMTAVCENVHTLPYVNICYQQIYHTRPYQ